MSESTLHLSLPLLLPAQAQKHVTHNEALRRLDAIVQLSVIAQTGTPPVAPTAGARYIVGPAATGVWAGQEDRVAHWDGETWEFIAPAQGWRAGLGEGDLVWTGKAWEGSAERRMQVAGLGIGATADEINRLVVAAEATLFNHAGGDHRLKLNKASPDATASLLFQSGYAGHAELGLSGSTDLSFKVSPDGQRWSEALRFDAGTGHAKGAAVQVAADDATAGRLMATGAFGMGGAAVICGDASALKAGGIYDYVTASGSWGGPQGVASARLWHSEGKDGASQILIGDGGMQIRSRAGTVWQEWRRLDAEHGSGAQGTFTRFPDGTLVCSAILRDAGAWDVAVASGFFRRGQPLVWTFPAAFVSAPAVTATAIHGADVGGVGLGALATARAELRPWSSRSMAASAAKSISCIAVGRWF